MISLADDDGCHEFEAEVDGSSSEFKNQSLKPTQRTAASLRWCLWQPALYLHHHKN